MLEAEVRRAEYLLSNLHRVKYHKTLGLLTLN